MTRNRIVAVALALVTALVLLLGWTFGVQPQLTAAAAADATSASVRADNDAQRLTLATMKKQYETIDSLTTKLTSLRRSVPAELDSGATLVAIQQVAGSLGVRVTGFTPGATVPYAAPVAAATSAAPAQAPAAGSTSAAGATSTPSPAPGTPQVVGGIVAVNAADTTQVGTGKFFVTPVTITIDGDLGRMLDFISAMQSSSTRLFVLTDGSVGIGSAGATITGLVYTLLDT